MQSGGLSWCPFLPGFLDHFHVEDILKKNLCQDSFHAVKESVSTGLYHSELVTDNRISGNFFSSCISGSSFIEQEGILDIIEEID